MNKLTFYFKNFLLNVPPTFLIYDGFPPERNLHFSKPKIRNNFKRKPTCLRRQACPTAGGQM